MGWVRGSAACARTSRCIARRHRVCALDAAALRAGARWASRRARASPRRRLRSATGAWPELGAWASPSSRRRLMPRLWPELRESTGSTRSAFLRLCGSRACTSGASSPTRCDWSDADHAATGRLIADKLGKPELTATDLLDPKTTSSCRRGTSSLLRAWRPAPLAIASSTAAHTTARVDSQVRHPRAARRVPRAHPFAEPSATSPRAWLLRELQGAPRAVARPDGDHAPEQRPSGRGFVLTPRLAATPTRVATTVRARSA